MLDLVVQCLVKIIDNQTYTESWGLETCINSKNLLEVGLSQFDWAKETSYVRTRGSGGIIMGSP